MIDFYAGVPGLQIANPIPNPGVLLNIVWRVLHMKDETLALAYAYLERSLKAKIPTKTFSGPQIDAHTLALTCLHLAAKMTDFPQPLPKILIVAWRLLRRGAPGPFPPLEQCSSSRLADCPLFCSLRNAIDATETLLLRILAFDIHFDTPVQYDQMYLARALLVAGAKSQDPNEDDSNPTTSDGVELEPPLEKGEENGTEAPLHGGDERGRTLIENLPTHIIQQIRGSSQQIRWLSLQACVLSRRAPRLS
ncbi:uncharacterized protein J3D65DRAFT_9499 [Phyllosticta citribraziliensis]|uniref:Cyclin N-terminal domain-containing protein n=1 Tax=Phyllosticta citribraziliensis TaxID=989973 RepID=A0ABR1M9T2_9PEZI